MFGNKKQEMVDEIKELRKQVKTASDHFQTVAKSRDRLDANLDEIRSSRQQVERDISQVNENTVVEVTYIQDNINTEAALIYELEHLVMDVNGQTSEIDTIKGEIRENYREILNLVDSNKHYTSLSKSLQDFSAEVSAQNKAYSEYLEQMNDYGRQMGVLAVNAAIEAGRLGEEGKQFIDAADEIRMQVGNYKTTIEEMQGKIQESNENIARMNEKIDALISLLKDNTVATGKIMKNAGETEKKLKSISNEQFRTGISAARTALIRVKSIDEDLLKTVERNRIQISDMEAEFDVQLRNEDEFISGLNPLFEQAQKYALEIDLEGEK